MSKNTAYDYDAIIVGSGPNGLAAAIAMAREGCTVLVVEAKETIGGGTRTSELTLPGFLHDVCSAIHPIGLASPFFRSLPLAEHGLKWIQPPIPFAHPLEDGTAVALFRSVEDTAQGLGTDEAAYRSWMSWLVANWEKIENSVLGPMHFPTHPFAMARFGLSAIQPSTWFIQHRFKGQRARALMAGLAGHSIMPLERFATTAFGMVEGILGHLVGWPLAEGGSQSITNALAGYLASLGGKIVTSTTVRSLKDLPPARAVLLDVTPRQLVEIAGESLPSAYRKQLEGFRYGAGVFKIDYALSSPIPWIAPEMSRTATAHIGGTLEEIALAERLVGQGEHPEKPFVLLAQQSLFDPSRAPQGKHTAWAYCHVPNGSDVDMSERIEAQIERFAPGFRDTILTRCIHNTADMQRYNPNYIGGDINGGIQDVRQLFTRPIPRLVPYSTPLKGIYLCSSSTPPGGGVHGMCGYHAAHAALKACF